MDPSNRLKVMRKVRADLQEDTIILISTFKDFAVGEARGSGSLLAVGGRHLPAHKDADVFRLFKGADVSSLLTLPHDAAIYNHTQGHAIPHCFKQS